MKKLITMLCLALCFVSAAGFALAATCAKKIEITTNNGLYIIKIPKEKNYKVYPYVTKLLTFNKDVFEKTDAELVINAGYFDPNNHKTSSYVVIDGQTILDPTTNKDLMTNKEVAPHLKTILNRTEFRVLDCGGETKYDIAAHNTRPHFRCKIVHSIQAGPMIYPDLKLSREYFVAKDKDGKVTRDSITALKNSSLKVSIGIKVLKTSKYVNKELFLKIFIFWRTTIVSSAKIVTLTLFNSRTL